MGGGTLPCLTDPLPGAGALRDLVSDTTPDGRSSAAAARPPGFTPGVAVVAAPEARGPLGPRHRWSLWTDGRWPRLILDSWGEPPRGIRRSPALSTGSGPSTRGPYAAARPRPLGRPGGNTCVRTGAEGLSGGNWMAAPRRPRYAGGAAPAGRLVRPFLIPTFFPPPGGYGRPGAPHRFGGAGAPRACPTNVLSG